MRSNHLADTTLAAPNRGLADSWFRAWFTPTDATSLHVLRIGTGLLLLAWLLPFSGQLDSFFGTEGWFDRTAFQDVRALQERMTAQQGEEVHFYKPMSWSLVYIPGLGVQGLVTLYWTSIAVLVLYTLGIFTRITAVLAWVIAVSFTANPAIEYDADAFLLFFTFYLMLGYVFFGQRQTTLSWAGRLLGTRDSWLLGNFAPRGEERHRSVAANLAVRLIQVNFAIVMVTTGLHKLQYSEWWSGFAFWFPNYPAFVATMQQAMEHQADREAYLSFLSLGAYAVLFWQIGFPMFAWRRAWAWRLVLIGGGVFGWIGCAFLYSLPLIGPAFLVGSLSFIAPEEWQSLFTGLARLTGLKRLAPAESAPLPEEKPAAPAPKEESVTLITAGER
jgi:hypothetical protein